MEEADYNEYFYLKKNRAITQVSVIASLKIRRNKNTDS